MGTSGAYGGSQRRQWRQARDLFIQLPDPAPGHEVDHGAPDPDLSRPDHAPSPDQESIDDLGHAVVEGLLDDDPSLLGPAPGDADFPLAALLPARRRGGGGGGGGPGGAGGVARGEGASPGRTGARSRRSVLRSGARGGAALGAGYALRRGDADALADAGLNLDELRQLSPRMQAARILDAVLGDPSHPDETALRRAAAEQLKQILQGDTPPDEGRALRGFIANLVFQLSLVELRSAIRSGGLDASSAARRERRLWRWIERRVRRVSLPAVGRVATSTFRAVAAQMTQEAFSILRAT